MKISIPKIIRPLRLAEYAPEYGEAQVQVHVNPSRETLHKVIHARRSIAALAEKGAGEAPEKYLKELEKLVKQITGWVAEIWSQGEDAETHWTIEEVDQIIQHSADTDPALWPWLLNSTLDLILEHREAAKKAPTPPSKS